MDQPVPNDSDLLNALVQECAEKWQEVGPQVVEDLCARHPALATALRRRLTLLQRSGLLDALPATELEAATPDRLGDFRLLGQLGAGGMGVVYRAEQVSLRREVALKVMRPDHSFFADSRQRFLREVNAIARLQHPGIVPVHVAGEERGVLYYAMELVPGCTLARVLEHLHGREPASLTGADLGQAVAKCAPPAAEGDPAAAQVFGGSWVECCLRLVQQIAEALEHAHGRGVLHRDVKPSNVMLTRAGRVMLLDFGLASTDTDPRITRSGAQLGSLAYMAPEQVRGDVAAIARTTDVYGAGVVLYELLSLQQPFLRRATEAIRQAILAGRPGSLRARNHALSTDAELVCLKAIDLDPARRYARAQDLARDLDNVLELRPIEARAPGVWLRARRAAQRHPARALSIGFTGLLLLGVFPALYLQQRSARLRIQEEKARTEAALAEVQVALTRAEAQEKRARWGLGKAREAVDRFLAEIGEFRAVDIPLLEQLRRDTLQQAASLYEQLLQDEGERDPALVFEHARTLVSLAGVLRELDRTSEAEPVLQRAIAALASGVPALDGEARRLLATARSALGSTLVSLGRKEAAETALAQAGAELRELLADSADPVQQATVKSTLLRTTVSLANLRAQERRVAEAAQLYEETVELEPGLPRNIEMLRSLAEARVGLALLLAGQSEPRPAAEEYRKAIALRREIVERAPSSARFRRELASTLENLGLLIHAWHSNRQAEALEILDESAALVATLVREYPRHSNYRVEYCRTRLSTASLREALGQAGDAERDLREAIDGLERVRSELPREKTWRLPLGFARYTLAKLYHSRGQDEQAAAEVDRAEALNAELQADSPKDTSFLQQQAELLLLRSRSRLATATDALAFARQAYAIGRPFVVERQDDARLYGTGFRCFERLAELTCAGGDAQAGLQVADSYRDAGPTKWLCLLTLARTYLLCRDLLAPGSEAERRRCLQEAIEAVHGAARHSLKAVLRIEDDAVFAPVRADPEVEDLLRNARAAKG